MENLNKKSNKDLMEYQMKLREDYEIVRKQLIQLYDHWDNINTEYNRVIDELNLRYGIKKID